MHSAVRLLALVIGGVAFGACGGSSTASFGAGAGDGDGGGASSGGTRSGTTSSGSSSGASSSSGSSSGGSSSSGSSSGSGIVYAIPLTSPGGPDFEYTVQATLGTQTMALSIDTGSTSAALAGAGCTTCTGVSPLYAPSSTAKTTGQQGSSTYLDGSGWSGPIYADAIRLGNGSPPVSVDLVDITKATGSFFSGQNDYQGILGLGPAGNEVTGTTGYIPELMAGGLSNILAFELCDGTGANAGTMWLGGDGSPASSVVYTPLAAITNDNPYYAFNLDGMSLGAASVATGASTFEVPVLDTGTSLFYVPTSVFNAFQTTLQASAGFKSLFGTSTFATSGQNQGCVTVASVTDAQVESTLPPLTLSLPNVTSGQPDVTLQASALDTYVYSGGGGQYCLAVQDGGTQDASTFGDAFMQAFHIVVDITGNRVGFAPTGCVAPQVRRARRPTETGPHRGPRFVRH